MKTKLKSARATLWAIRTVGLILAILLFAMPELLRLYAEYRFLDPRAFRAVLVAFYCCAAVTGVALLRMDRLIRNILKGQVFIQDNVALIRQVRWCCCCVSLICVPAAVLYAPLLFVVVIMGFLCLAVSVTADVMDAAVKLREESDLTV